jgi:hypothetical protein
MYVVQARDWAFFLNWASFGISYLFFEAFNSPKEVATFLVYLKKTQV